MNENDKGLDVKLKQQEEQITFDVMTNFVESGYSQWFMNLDYKRKDVEADELDIIEMSFEEFDEDTMTPLVDEKGNRTVFTITPEKVIAAMRKIDNGDVEISPVLQKRIHEALVDRDYANLDAETDDCIVQVACFGTLVYG
jgi:hypothetical protein